MVKGIGILLLVLTGAGMGGYAAMIQRKACLACERLCQMLGELGVQIGYAAAPLPELFAQLAAAPAYEIFSFPKEVLSRLREGSTLEEAWHRALETDKVIPAAVRQMLLPLGDTLGCTDIWGQQETLAQFQQQLKPYAEEFHQLCQKREKLYWSMGILAGLMAAILLS